MHASRLPPRAGRGRRRARRAPPDRTRRSERVFRDTTPRRFRPFGLSASATRRPDAAVPLTLVLGGARSGKSRHAEALARATGLPRLYVATAEPFDDEMRERIDRHRADRAGDGWQTVEAPLDLAEALRAARATGGVTLVDCATLWLSNLLLAERDVAAAQAELLATLAVSGGPVVIVSNEVGFGIVPETPLGRRFRDAQGRLNAALAAAADRVTLVVAGLPLDLKPAGSNRP